MFRGRCDRLARGAAVVSLLSLAPGLAGAQQARSTPDAAATAAAVAQLQSLSDAFATVAARVRPSVVYITARQAPRAAQRDTRNAPTYPGLPPELRRYFEPGAPDGGAPPRRGRASGSGFIVSSDGYVLTNAHVVDSSTQVTVRLLDRREFTARIVGTDPSTDVAVLKIEATGLTPAPLGDSDRARVGEWVLAVGNPLGENLTFTVTQGIISAKGRSLALPNRSQSSIQDFIQTDAAINPGNSGGPLINVRGEVIGINSAIASGTGYYAGYGFAIPITLAKQVMDDLIKFGKIRRAVVGVSLLDPTPADAKAAGMTQPSGAKVQGFNPENDSPGQKAGLEIGDIIITADGKPVDQVSTLQRIIRGHKPGDVVDLEAMRFGQKKSFKVKLGEPPVDLGTVASNDDSAPATRTNDVGKANDKLGISVEPVSSEFAQQARLATQYRAGLRVTNVTGRGPAFRTLFENDVILSELFPQQRQIKTVEDLQAAVSSLKPGDVIEFKKCTPLPTGNCQTAAVSIQIDK